jgi:bifunctional non-homologous end joining protein LigD
VSSLGKPYFPADGITKGDVMRYYALVAPAILPQLDGRPLALKRFPNGIEGHSFFQQNAPEHLPDGIRIAEVATEEEPAVPRLVGGDLRTLLYTVQLGAIAVHAWLSRLRALDAPDFSLIDLDPGEGVEFVTVVTLAREIGRILDEFGLKAAVKSSGSRGIHVGIPLAPHTSYETSARLAESVAEELIRRAPEVATLERRIANRPRGSVYVDVQQNAKGKSVVAPYSVRARPGATVSGPVRWSELGSRFSLRQLTIRTVPRRLARVGDLWGEGMRESNSSRIIRNALR